MTTQTSSAPDKQSMMYELRLLPRPFYLLILGTFISRFGHFVVPFLAVYLRQLGFEAAVTGYTLAAYGAGGFVASILGGYLADRIGRKPTLLISCFGAAIAMLLLSEAATITAFIVGAFLSGLMTCMFYPAASSLIADLVPEERRIRAYAVHRFAINLAFALGMATAGLLASSSFYALFIADAATTAVLGLIILFGLKRGIGNKSDAAAAGWRAALASIARNTPFLRAAAAGSLCAIIFWQVSSTFGLQVIEVSRFSESTYGYLLALNGVMIVFIEIPLTNWTRRFDPQRTMALGYALVGLGLALLVFSGSLAMLIASIVVLTLGEMICLPVSSSYNAALAPEEMRGRYMGVIALSWNVAIGIGPMLGLAVFDHSPRMLWALCGVIGLLAAWIILIRKNYEKDSNS